MAAARRNQRDNDDSTVIYDIGQVRQVAVYEDRRYAYERTGRAGAEQEGTSPKPAATAGAEHVENTPASHSPERPAVADADVYQVVDLEMVNECRTDTDEAADATVANADVTSDQLQPHTQGENTPLCVTLPHSNRHTIAGGMVLGSRGNLHGICSGCEQSTFTLLMALKIPLGPLPSLLLSAGE